MSPQKQRSTFISYSRVNKEFAIKLTLELRSMGFDVWLDQLDIPPGARWDDEVEYALERCEIFMVILTPASMASDNVKDEIGYAIDNRKRILPILLENATIPLRLRRFQYVDFTSRGFDDGVEGAKQLLKRLIDEPTLPRMEIPPAFRTQEAGTDQMAGQAEAERKAKEEAERLARQQAEEERIRKAEMDAQRLAAEKAEAERIAKHEAERLETQRAEDERIRKAEMETQRLATEKAETERKAKEEADRLAREKAEAQGLAAVKAEADRKAREKAESERIRLQKAEAARIAKEKKEAERLATLKAKEELKAREEAERVASLKAEKEQPAQEKLEPMRGQAQTKAQPPSLSPTPIPQKTATTSAPAGKKSRLPLIIGMAGAGALVVLAIIVVAAVNMFSTDIPNTGAPENNQAAAGTSASPAPLLVESEQTDTPAPTSIPPTETSIPPTNTPEVQQFFTETFQEDYSKNWSYFLREGDENKFSITNTSDGLLVELNDQGIWSYLVYEPFEYTDVRIDVVVENLGVNENNITLICRYSPQAGWYEFNIASSGLWDMFFTRPDAAGNLNYGFVTEGGSTKIKTGKATNKYSIICAKDSLTLLINDVETKTIPLPSYVLDKGKVGISASSFGQIPVQVKFKEVKISKP